MENLSEKSSLLLSRLPQITDLKELIDLSCSLLQSSLYIVDGQGIILEHSARENVNCESWLNAVAEGRLSEAHRKSVLTPEVNCNVIRDKACKEPPVPDFRSRSVWKTGCCPVPLFSFSGTMTPRWKSNISRSSSPEPFQIFCRKKDRKKPMFIRILPSCSGIFLTINRD